VTKEFNYVKLSNQTVNQLLLNEDTAIKISLLLRKLYLTTYLTNNLSSFFRLRQVLSGFS